MYNTTPITFNMVYLAPRALESISRELALKPIIYRSIVQYYIHTVGEHHPISTLARYTIIIQYIKTHYRPGNNHLSAHTLRFSPEPNTQRYPLISARTLRFSPEPNTLRYPLYEHFSFLAWTEHPCLSHCTTLRFSPEPNTQCCPQGSQETSR